jgi:prepilin-type N-terminal cleavage/methylation domain-containing protein
MRNRVSFLLRPPRRQKALTLTELLCVIAIISILLAMYLPVIAKAFLKVKNLVGH